MDQRKHGNPGIQGSANWHKDQAKSCWGWEQSDLKNEVAIRHKEITYIRAKIYLQTIKRQKHLDAMSETKLKIGHSNSFQFPGSKRWPKRKLDKFDSMQRNYESWHCIGW